MTRPRRKLGDFIPALAYGQGAVTMNDMGAQIIEQTWVAGTPGGINIVVHSFKTTQVAVSWVPLKGQSYHSHLYQVTDPTTSAVVIGITGVNDSGFANNRNVFGQLRIYQIQ